ncbi:efflux RND transporter periplasmic adaptor subunit [Tautonia sociabilis]|uniref:Efflux RND transporter periplasmic adaptor subunit n=1 Tax=Tautonia sociabilis TaxID=2080755 RepID=A0A432MII4_9BACT|nr:efflux RND transporter periplasmic adaptor subunit [Tautonia sociabilis]RUL87008.1 efflux RND transporter periplasmic adaptor subunit [Tautonia sociabilis]
MRTGDQSQTTRAADHLPGRILTLLLLLLLAGFVAGCRGEGRSGGDEHEHGHEHGEESGHDEHGHGSGEDEHGHGEEGEDEHEHGEHGHGEGAEHIDEATLAPAAIERYGLRMEVARKQALNDSVTAPARVSYDRDRLAHVGSPVPGRVVELKVQLGDRVQPGDVVLIVESPQFGEAQNDFRSRRAAVDAARSAYERSKTLLERSQGIALGEVQKREVELRVAETEAQAAESKLRLLGFDSAQIAGLLKSGETTSRYPIRSPLGGTVVKRHAMLGELVGPEHESLLIIADTGTLWVLADVPEGRLKDVVVGSSARVKVPAAPGEPYEGVVTVIDPALDRATRTAEVRIEVKDLRGRLKPEMFAEATIFPPAGAAEEVLAVPSEAVQTVEGSPAVFVPVEGEANTFAKRPVRVGPAVGGMVPVLSGLEEGERYVAAGTFILKAELGKAGAAHEH